MPGREQVEEGAPVEKETENQIGSAGAEKVAKGNARRKPTEYSGTCTGAISLVGWEQKLEGVDGESTIGPFS